MGTLLKISDAAALAFHATSLLAAQDGKALSTKSIATTLRASECHLSKVLQRLAKAGLVSSVRGPRGGFTLATDPATVSLLDVYEAIEGPFVPGDCLLKIRVCDPNGERMLGGLLGEINQRVKDCLSRTHLASLTHLYQGRESDC